MFCQHDESNHSKADECSDQQRESKKNLLFALLGKQSPAFDESACDPGVFGAIGGDAHLDSLLEYRWAIESDPLRYRSVLSFSAASSTCAIKSTNCHCCCHVTLSPMSTW